MNDVIKKIKDKIRKMQVDNNLLEVVELAERKFADDMMIFARKIKLISKLSWFTSFSADPCN